MWFSGEEPVLNKSIQARFWKGLLVLFVLFLGFPQMVEGSPGPIKLEVYPGFDGEMKGDWVPVRVKITNSGAAVEGELIARRPDIIHRLHAVERVKLAGGTSREVSLLLSPALASPETEVVFRTDEGVVARERLRGKDRSDMDVLIGVLSDSPELSSQLKKWIGTTARDPEILVKGIKAEELPNRDLGLSGLDVLVINGIEIDSLGKSRQKAIRRWVEEGGLLVVAGPSSASSPGKLGSILPVQGKGKGKAALKDLKPFSRWGNVPDLNAPLTISRVRLADGGQAIVSAGDLPLLARRPAGAGVVIYAAYDLTAPPLAEWSGNQRLWREMLFLGKGDGAVLRLGNLVSSVASLEEVLMQLPPLRLPSLSVMAALFLVYALGIGPGVFWILNRLNRREWAWWVIPSLGIVVSLGIYAYGQITRGSDVLVHNLAYVETKDSGEARVQGVSAFWSQGAGTYRLNGKSNLWLWPLSQREQSRSEAAVSTRPSVAFFDVPYWAPREISVETTAFLGGDLRAVATFRDGAWRWEVKNGTRLFLRDVNLIQGDRVYRVGSLAPGETRTLKAEDVSLGIQNEFPDLLKPELIQMRQQKMERRREQTREELMQDLVTGYWVTGWTEEPVFSYEVQGYETRSENLTMVLGRLEVEPIKRGNRLLWSRGTLPFRYVEEKPLMPRPPKDQGWASPEMIAYDLPSAPSEWEPLRMEVSAGKEHAAVYDWNRGRWVEAARLPDLSPEELSALVSPFNRVVMLVDGSGEKPLLEVEGRVVQ